jgi:hypothetical protein
MKKIIIAIIASLLALSIFIIIKSSQNKPIPASSNEFQPFDSTQGKRVSSVSPSPTSSLNLMTYTDLSGFSFQYPKGLIVFPVVPLKNLFYADLTATASGKVGKTTITIESSIIKSLSDYKKSNKDLPKVLINTKLADLDALDYNDKTNYITQAIDEGTLITITTPNTDKTFWDLIHKTIVSSFKFIQPTLAPAAVGSSDSEDDVVYEGEEIVE